ncbi:MAG: ABC transporter permease, partial [Acidimicrobiales bacterium]
LGCHDGYCRMWSLVNSKKGQRSLMSVAAEASQEMEAAPKVPWFAPIERLGHGTMRGLSEAYDTIVFFGQFSVVLVKMILQPHRIRWKSVVALIEEVGLDAMPIVVILSFFIGAVIAFMGSDLLEVLGFQVFVVDLVGVSVLREFAVLITAILLAGRSNSAFTAQIGSMKMRQEIDAMTVIGLDTNETLVAPRALACLVSAPILTFAAMMAGILGGLLVCWTQDISPVLFTARLTEVVDVKHFWVGMVKAPVYGLVVAIIGCRQGLAVGGSVESLGSRTTTSVVQAIFTVIFLDALFAMMFLEMGV